MPYPQNLGKYLYAAVHEPTPSDEPLQCIINQGNINAINLSPIAQLTTYLQHSIA
ncbi:hypothetical protein [Vulcanisaeta sp. JCM 14467]